MVLQAAQHRRHASAAADAHDARSALPDPKVVDAIEETLRVRRQHVGQRAVQTQEGEDAQPDANREKDGCSHEKWHELQREDAHPPWYDRRAVYVGKREADAETDHDHAQKQHAEPALHVQTGPQQLEHRRHHVITREATKLTRDTSSAPRNAAPKSGTTMPPPWMTEASQNTMAFTTRVNSPSVRRLSGRVSSNRIGRKNAFSRPRIRAKTRAVASGESELMTTRLSSLASSTARAVASSRSAKRRTAPSYAATLATHAMR